MTEPRLEGELTTRFGRLAWVTVAAYAVLVVVVFTLLSEMQLRRTLEDAADAAESLLDLYTEPAGSPATVAPEALAARLVGMGLQFAITRTQGRGDSGAVYFLSPGMPAQRLEGMAAGTTPETVRAYLLEAVAARARWRYRILHRASGEFDIYVVASRVSALSAVAGLSGVALLLLPAVVVLARRRARAVVAGALAPLERAIEELRTVGPDELDRRLVSPTGQAEVTELADSVNRMLERVERAQQMLRAFTADASHELRSPLAYVKAQAQWAQRGGRSAAEQREALAAIVDQVDRTTAMVEDLLLIARGENRQLDVQRRAFDVMPIAREVAEIGGAMAAGGDVTVRVSGDGGARGVGDPDRTRHVLLNLVSNAVRYTAQGAVEIAVRRDGTRVGLAVTDTGPGIPPEHARRVFDRFYRVEGSRDRSLGGAGLGLTIARVLAELQAGSITLESEVGRGSTFTLWLPGTERSGRGSGGKEGGVG